MPEIFRETYPAFSPRARTLPERRVPPLLAVTLILALNSPLALFAEDAPGTTVAAPATEPLPPPTALAPAFEPSIPAGDGPKVIIQKGAGPEVNVSVNAPQPGLRADEAASVSPPSTASAPARKAELLPNGDLPPDFEQLPRLDQLHLLVDQRVQAAGVLLKDANTGEVLFARDENGLYPPASTTKLLTALLFYETAGLDGVITVAEADTKVEPSHVPLLVGERVRSRDLVYSLLVGSDNDSAMALGRHAAGTLPQFMTMMNRYAFALGCQNSTFKNPNGLPAEGQYTTAADLMVIFERVLERPQLRDICVVKEFPLTTKKGTQTVKNHNKLLGRYIGMGPAKTGWTRASQHTYAAYVSRGNRAFTLTLLKSPNKWFDAHLLFDYAFSVRLAKPELLPEGVPAMPLLVSGRNLITQPGGEVKKGALPPEGLVIISAPLPGSLAETSTAATVKEAPKAVPVETAPAPAAEYPKSGTLSGLKTRPGSRQGILESADGTRYLASAVDEESGSNAGSGTNGAAPSGYRFRDYKIRHGDTLAVIANRHGCTIEMIERYNEIPNRNRIVPGQYLRVPQRLN